MTRKCPKCHRGNLETWGIEVADIHDPEFKHPVGEAALLTVCPRCGWQIPHEFVLEAHKGDA